jgi:4-hydroxybenzoate polyprenyltransferase
VGWASQTSVIGLPAIILYVGCILWVIGYDTIYALQDVEDDALVGVKSTARLFGERAQAAVMLFYTAAMACWIIAGSLAGAGWIFIAALVVPAAILVWQVATLDRSSPANALVRFKANHWVGLALTLAFLADAYF